MDRINLDALAPEPLAGHTSKGDQPKWQVRGKWYKADHMGYEALAEVVVSGLMEKSNIENYVRYQPVLIGYQGRELQGCVSDNFRRKGEMLVPLERLHRAYYGQGLSQTMSRMQEVRDRIRYTVDFVERVTGLTNMGQYLTTMLELDAFFLNEDRHTNNLAVIRGEATNQFRFCPIFDNGLSLLSDLNDYPMDADMYHCIEKVCAKPFSSNYDEQVEAANELYGTYLRFQFTKQDVTELLEQLRGGYPEVQLQRVQRVIFEQMRRYRIFF